MMKVPATGDMVTAAILTKLYDRYATDVLRSVLVQQPRARKQQQRYRVDAARAAEAAAKLQCVVDFVNELITDDDDSLQGFVDELDTAASELEGVEFPGMY